MRNWRTLALAAAATAVNFGHYASAAARDYTSEINLIPGLSITFPVRDGIDTRRKPIGDYDFNVKVLDAGDAGFKYEWQMGAPAGATGTRSVTSADQKSAHSVSLFYHDKQKCTLLGSTNIVRVSDVIYAALSSGLSASFKVDGPEKDVSPQGTIVDEAPLPTSIRPLGRETAYVWFNDKRVPVRAIKAEADNGWQYWILDSAKFPIMVGGAGPFYWSEPRFDSRAADAQNEAKRVTQGLQDNGIATSHAILFAFDSDKLTEPSKQILKSIGSFLSANPTMKIQVEGHTDNVGGLDYNLGLSRRRAESVERYLINECGIPADRLTPVGCGYAIPVADNQTEQGRAQNRRVVFKRT